MSCEQVLQISGEVEPGAHAVLILDQVVGTSAKPIVPKNITLLVLPSRFSELNPVENVGQLMRDNSLSNRIFTSYDDIVDQCCEASNKFIEYP